MVQLLGNLLRNNNSFLSELEGLKLPRVTEETASRRGF